MIVKKALMSLGEQDPAFSRLALRNERPIRESFPIPSATSLTSVLLVQQIALILEASRAKGEPDEFGTVQLGDRPRRNRQFEDAVCER